MFNRWRDEIESGRQRARDLSGDMLALAWGMIRAALALGFGVGLVIGGFLVWLIK